MSKVMESLFVKLGREHPGWAQGNLRPDATPDEIEAAQWHDGAGYWERNLRDKKEEKVA